MRPVGIFLILELLKTRDITAACFRQPSPLLYTIKYNKSKIISVWTILCKFGTILFLTVVWTMNRCNPSIYAGYSDFGFRNEIW